MNASLLIGIGALGALILAGCTLPERMRDIQNTYTQMDERVGRAHRDFGAETPDRARRQTSQQVDKPWIAGRSQPLARELTLPPPLRAQVRTTLLFAEGAEDLREIAHRISAVTGIPVLVRPDALLPASYFLPRLANEALQAQAAGVNHTDWFKLTSGPEPLAQILDRIATYLDIQWRYRDKRIEFFRTETRVFNVHALTLAAKAHASLGMGRQDGQGGFVGASSTHLSSPELDGMQAVQTRVQAFLSRAGTLVAGSGADATLVVTDTPEVLERVAHYLAQENRALTRRIRLVFEELTLSLDEQAQASLDWGLIFANAQMVAGFGTPAFGADPASRLALGITTGRMSGSEAVIKALGETARLVRRSSVPLLTLNRRPISHTVRTTFSYIDQVETTPTIGADGLAIPAVSINQKEETVGSMLTLLPDAQDDGQILLSMAYDNTVALPLKSITFGDRANPLQLQQLTVEGNGSVQQLALQPGQPLVVSGFDRQQSESGEHRLNPGLPLVLGGGDRMHKQRLATVLIITAQVEEGL